MKMLELTREQQRLARTILRNRFPGRQALAFGSRIHGTAKPWSDLDLAILGDEPISDLALAEARADFEEPDLPFRVDLSLFQDLPRAMQLQIEQRGQPLLAAQPGNCACLVKPREAPATLVPGLTPLR